MFITSFLTFMTIGGFPSFLEDMKVCFACHLSIALLFLFFLRSKYLSTFMHKDFTYLFQHAFGLVFFIFLFFLSKINSIL